MVRLTSNQSQSTTINGYFNVLPLYETYDSSYNGSGNILTQPTATFGGDLTVYGNIICRGGLTGLTGLARPVPTKQGFKDYAPCFPRPQANMRHKIRQP